MDKFLNSAFLTGLAVFAVLAVILTLTTPFGFPIMPFGTTSSPIMLAIGLLLLTPVLFILFGGIQALRLMTPMLLVHVMLLAVLSLLLAAYVLPGVAVFFAALGGLTTLLRMTIQQHMRTRFV